MIDPSQNPPPQLGKLLDSAKDFTRREPAQATAYAFGFGFLLHLLPLGAIARLLINIVLVLLRPALLFLGLFKAWELSNCKCCKTLTTPDHE